MLNTFLLLLITKNKMNTLHSHRLGYILLLVIFHSSVFGLVSNKNISSDADSTFKSQTAYTHYGKDMGKEYIMCTEANIELPWKLSCTRESKDVVTKINFADYGNPSGKCEHYKHGNCGASTTMKVVKKVSKINCRIVL